VLELFKDTHIAIVTSNTSEELKISMSEIRHKLSIIWDKGRFLFPNMEQDTYGQNKDGAYKSIRQPILDRVADFHRALEFEIKVLSASKIDNALSVDEQKYVVIRRRFVTEAQKLMRTNERFALAGLRRDTTAA
jgi:hypothetical protein